MIDIGPMAVIKDKNIRIFREIEQSSTPIKQYIHPRDTYLKAYIRQLTSSEQASANALQDRRYIEVIINPRKVEVDMYVEFKGKTYQIESVDEFMFYETDAKFQAYEVNTKDYIDVRWQY